MSQIVAYYDKCCGWYKGGLDLGIYWTSSPISALVVRARKQPEAGADLKFAAAMADSGDLRDITEELWAGDDVGLEKVKREPPRCMPPSSLTTV